MPLSSYMTLPLILPVLDLIPQAVKGIDAEPSAEVGATNIETLTTREDGAEGYDRFAGGNV